MTIIDSAVTTETKIALVSAVAAIISALMAWHSAATAKSALKLAEADHKEKHVTIKPYLIDSVCWQNDKLENFVSFACSFTNAANAPNTIVRMDLNVHAYDEEGNPSRVILNPIIEDAPSLWDLKKLPAPVNLESRSTLSGWISFKLPLHFVTKRRIDKYELVSTTSLGERVIVESYLLRRLTNDDRQG